jgi:hypothetical protein
MPKRSERDRFPTSLFDSNPFAGVSAEKLFEELRWGDTPDKTFEVESPEELVTLGTLARIDLDGARPQKFDEETGPFLAVGARTNLLYIVPRKADGSPIDVPAGPYEESVDVHQTDYFSQKGGEESYYYHEHEDPYPVAFVNHESGVVVLMPRLHEGKRSYAVAKEGIVG